MTSLLLAAGANETATDKFHHTAAELSALVCEGRTAIITDGTFLKHHTCDPIESATPNAPPENTHRLVVLCDESNGILRSSDVDAVWEESCPKASLADVLRVHEWSYVRKIQVGLYIYCIFTTVYILYYILYMYEKYR
jgi:hypothetical protein